MKFIIDAQLPVGLKRFLNNSGFDAIHTDDLPEKERTTDRQIRQISVLQDRIVISKDSDFIDSYYIQGIPKKLLVISTGNIKTVNYMNYLAKNLVRLLYYSNPVI